MAFPKYLSALLLFLPFVSLAQNPMVVAHRGASYDAPENTIASAKLAWKKQADAVEIDIHLSQDGKVMVHHDPTTKKITGVNLKIKETPSEELRKLDVGSFKSHEFKEEKMPFLEEIIETIPEGKKLVIEIKSGIDVVPAMTEIIKKSSKVDQMIFISFDYEAIVMAKKNFPNNKAFYLLWKLPFKLDKQLSKYKSDGLDGIDVKHSLVDPSLMEASKNQGLEVHVYTVNEKNNALELQKLGVNSITTDRPKFIKDNLLK